MGAYVYRVTAKRVTCSDGKPANVAIYAYKPYWGFSGRDENAKMHFRSGATSSDAMADKGKLSGRFVMGHKDAAGVIRVEAGASVFEYGCGHFVDSAVGTDSLPALENVKAPAASFKK